MANDRMMVTKAKIDRIGDALREKKGESVQYTLDEMPEAIRSIETGGGGENEYIALSFKIINDTIIGLSPMILENYVVATDQNVIE